MVESFYPYTVVIFYLSFKFNIVHIQAPLFTYSLQKKTNKLKPGIISWF